MIGTRIPTQKNDNHKYHMKLIVVLHNMKSNHSSGYMLGETN